MNKRKRNIIIVIAISSLILLTLWISGVIPKLIAKNYGTYYLKKNFSKMQLEYVNIEWNSAFGEYTIQFKDENSKLYGFLIGPKYFPVSFGQGMFGFEEEYREKYSE